MSDISARIKRLYDHIEKVCLKVGRNPSEIKIVGITKNVEPARIKDAYNAGLKVFGENRVQEALKKIMLLPDDIEWHFVGHLQTNKVKSAIKNFSLIQSVDSIHLAEKISYEAEKIGKIIPVLIEINSSGEATKCGFSIDEVELAIMKIKTFNWMKILGIMTIGPLTNEIKRIEDSFNKTRELFERLKKEFDEDFKILSMGMTDDYEIAIACGSNMIRIGRGIFGERV